MITYARQISFTYVQKPRPPLFSRERLPNSHTTRVCSQSKRPFPPLAATKLETSGPPAAAAAAAEDSTQLAISLRYMESVGGGEGGYSRYSLR